MQRWDRTYGKCKQATIRHFEYDASCSTVVPRSGGAKPLFPLASLTGSCGGDLCQNLGVAQPAFSHDTFSTARATSRRSPLPVETQPRHRRLASAVSCECGAIGLSPADRSPRQIRLCKRERAPGRASRGGRRMRTRNPASLRTVGTEIITYPLGYCYGSVPGSVASAERARRIESVPSRYYCRILRWPRHTRQHDDTD